MPPPVIRELPGRRHRERGVTIVFVALAMVAILAMAALSIDVVVLYLAKEEAQRSADAAALAAARVLSLSGVTGDPQYSQVSSWQEACNQARLVAQAMVNQNTIGRGLANVVTVTFPLQRCSDRLHRRRSLCGKSSGKS